MNMILLYFLRLAVQFQCIYIFILAITLITEKDLRCLRWTLSLVRNVKPVLVTNANVSPNPNFYHNHYSSLGQKPNDYPRSYSLSPEQNVGSPFFFFNRDVILNSEKIGDSRYLSLAF